MRNVSSFREPGAARPRRGRVVQDGMTPFRSVASIVALVAATGLLVGVSSDASCADMIEWKGVRYEAANLEGAIHFLTRVGKANVPSCIDEDGAGCSVSRGATDERSVYRLPGVEPAVAVGARGPFGRTMYLAPGYFLQLPDHPLHIRVYGSSRRPNEQARWQCGAAIDLVGRVVNQTPGLGRTFNVRFEGDRVERQYGWTALFVDAYTTIRGFDRGGLPYIEEGDRLRATVRECTSGERYKVVAEMIDNAN
jgi:hypothetical protein